MIVVKSNLRWRNLECWDDLPPKFQREVDYIEGAQKKKECRFVRYMGWVYDVFEAQGVPRGESKSVLRYWDGVIFETFSSGKVFKLSGFRSAVICGRFYVQGD